MRRPRFEDLACPRCGHHDDFHVDVIATAYLDASGPTVESDADALLAREVSQMLPLTDSWVFVVDNSLLSQTNRYAKVRIELDRIINDEQALSLHLEQLLNRPIVSAHVREIDCVRETMRLDVQTGPRK